MSIATAVSDRRTEVANDADAALIAMARRLADSDSSDVDPDEVLAVCDAAGVDEQELQRMIDSFHERIRLIELSEKIDARRDACDAAGKLASEHRDIVLTAEKKHKDSILESINVRGRWKMTRAALAESTRAINALTRPEFSRFDSPDAIDRRRDDADRDATKIKNRRKIADARGRVADLEFTIGSIDRRIARQTGVLEHHKLSTAATAEAREVEKGIESLRVDLADKKTELRKLKKTK